MGWLRGVFTTEGDGFSPAPEVAQLRAYWETLRCADTVPRRADFNPRAISGLLSHALLLERIAPGQARIRLAGMGLCDIAGMDLRGMPLFALIDARARDRFRPMVEAVFARPAIVTMRLETPRGLLRPQLGGQMCLLPLRGHGGAIDRALGIFAPQGAAGRAPSQFDMISARIDPLALGEDSATADCQAISLPRTASAPEKARPHLRLVHSR